MAFDPLLGSAFGFDADDLAANRARRLTPDQSALARRTAELRGRQGRGARRLLALAMVAAAALALVAYALSADRDPLALAVPAAVLLWIVLIVALFARRSRRGVASLDAGLAVATGAFAWDSDLSGEWWGTVGAARFALDRLAADRLEVGARYRVHYLLLDGRAWVQSIERI